MDNVPITFSSKDREAGSQSFYQISLQKTLNRARRIAISNITIPHSWYNINPGNSIFTYNLGGGANSINVYLETADYDISQLVDELRGRLSETQANFTPIYELDTKLIRFESNYPFTILERGSVTNTTVPPPSNPLRNPTVSTILPELGFNNAGESGGIFIAQLDDLYKITSNLSVQQDIIVRSRNNAIPFYHNIPGGNNITVTVANGTYTCPDFANVIETQLNAALANTFSVRYNMVKNTFNIYSSKLFRILNTFTADLPTFLNLPIITSPALELFGNGFNNIIQPSLTIVACTAVFSLMNEKFNIVIPAITTATLEEAASNLQTAFRVAYENINVTVNDMSNGFIISSDLPISIVGDVAFDANYGLSFTRDSTRIYGTVFYYPTLDYTLSAANSLIIDIQTGFTLEMPIGNFTQREFFTLLSDLLNTQFGGDLTVTHNNNSNKYSLSAVAPLTDPFFIFYSTNAPNLLLGLSNGYIKALAIGNTIEFPDSIIQDIQYISIKSNFLQNHLRYYNFTNNNTNTIKKVLVNEEFNKLTNYIDEPTGIIPGFIMSNPHPTFIRLSRELPISIMDFRIESPTGQLLELNGQNWSLDLIVEVR